MWVDSNLARKRLRDHYNGGCGKCKGKFLSSRKYFFTTLRSVNTQAQARWIGCQMGILLMSLYNLRIQTPFFEDLTNDTSGTTGGCVSSIAPIKSGVILVPADAFTHVQLGKRAGYSTFCTNHIFWMRNERSLGSKHHIQWVARGFSFRRFHETTDRQSKYPGNHNRGRL